jgi:hypothetical protein
MDPDRRLEYLIPAGLQIRRCVPCWITWHYPSRAIRDTYRHCPICGRYMAVPRVPKPHTSLNHPGPPVEIHALDLFT